MYRKVLSFAAALFFIFLSFPQNYSAAQAQAVDLTLQTVLHLGSQKSVAALTDRDLTTGISADTLQIQSEAPVCGLYLVWDTVPDRFSLQFGDDYSSELSYSSDFLHQFITLQSKTDFRLAWTGNPASLAEIYVFSEGQLPDWVQRWEEPCEKADILLLPTHADDEFLFFGGTVPYYAGQKGLSVQVAYMTYHTKDRWHELLDGLWHAGATAYPVIPEFKDLYCKTYKQAKELYDEEKILDYYVSLLRRFRPEVVVGHDLSGEYGHGAHMLSAELLTKALDEAANPNFDVQSFRKYGVWDVKKCYLHLYGERKLTMLWDSPLPAFGGNTGAQVALESYRKHLSQQGFFPFSVTGKTGCAYFGLYRTTVGEDREKNDFLENIPEECLTTSMISSTEAVQAIEPVATESGTLPEQTSQTEPQLELPSVAFEVEIDKNEIYAILVVVAVSAAATVATMLLLKRREK